MDKNFATLCLKQPRNCFSKKHIFDTNFFTKPTLTYFLGQTDLWRVWEENCSRRKLRYLLPKTPLKSFFQKTHFQTNFFTKPPPHLFLEPNELCDAFGVKIVLDKNFATFCLKRPRNRFSKKHVSDPNVFYETAPSPIFEAKQTR